MANERLDLQDLVENPPENLEIDLKDWIDLTSDVARASIARHIAALANFGGGYLLFGFQDDRTRSPSNPYTISSYNRDTFSAIVKKYLTPAFQCDVDQVTSTRKTAHIVVRIPSHGAEPVCSKADGPPDAKGRPQGIRVGTYYTRAPGPESVPIRTPEHWAPLIRRCIVNERTTLLGLFDSIMRPPIPSSSQNERLKTWHGEAITRFKEMARRRQAPNDAQAAYVVLSYAIQTADADLLDPTTFINVLRQAYEEVHDVTSSPSLFTTYRRREIAPHFVTDPAAGQGDREFVEASIFPDVSTIDGSTSSMWRASLDGFATNVSTYEEDKKHLQELTGRPARTWFWPFMLARTLGELVRHARALSSKFPSASSVQFRCEWTGLHNRFLYDPRPSVMPWSGGYVFQQDRRITSGTWTTGELINRARIAAVLGAPVMRAVYPEFEFSETWVERQLAPRDV